MASQNVVEFTDQNFKQDVIESDKPVLVDFWAEWCQPCKMLAPTIDEIADEFGEKIKVGKLDTDKNRDVSVEFKITAIPTVIIFKDGEVAKKFADDVIVTDDNPRSEDPAEIRNAVLKGAPDALEIAERAEAIVAGVRKLKKGDALLIAGKGHETYQEIQGEEIPFSDKEVARAALASAGGAGA